MATERCCQIILTRAISRAGAKQLRSNKGDVDPNLPRCWVDLSTFCGPHKGRDSSSGDEEKAVLFVFGWLTWFFWEVSERNLAIDRGLSHVNQTAITTRPEMQLSLASQRNKSPRLFMLANTDL